MFAGGRDNLIASSYNREQGWDVVSGPNHTESKVWNNIEASKYEMWINHMISNTEKKNKHSPISYEVWWNLYSGQAEAVLGRQLTIYGPLCTFPFVAGLIVVCPFTHSFIRLFIEQIVTDWLLGETREDGKGRRAACQSLERGRGKGRDAQQLRTPG